MANSQYPKFVDGKVSVKIDDAGMCSVVLEEIPGLKASQWVSLKSAAKKSAEALEAKITEIQATGVKLDENLLTFLRKTATFSVAEKRDVFNVLDIMQKRTAGSESRISQGTVLFQQLYGVQEIGSTKIEQCDNAISVETGKASGSKNRYYLPQVAKGTEDAPKFTVQKKKSNDTTRAYYNEVEVERVSKASFEKFFDMLEKRYLGNAEMFKVVSNLKESLHISNDEELKNTNIINALMRTIFAPSAFDTQEGMKARLKNKNVYAKPSTDAVKNAIETLGTVTPTEKKDTEEKKADDDFDSLFKEAVKFVIKEQRASFALIQRIFGIGFVKAGRVLDRMEDMGVIAKPDSEGKRKVLLKSVDDFDKMTSEEAAVTEEPTPENPTPFVRKLTPGGSSDTTDRIISTTTGERVEETTEEPIVVEETHDEDTEDLEDRVFSETRTETTETTSEETTTSDTESGEGSGDETGAGSSIETTETTETGASSADETSSTGGSEETTETTGETTEESDAFRKAWEIHKRNEREVEADIMGTREGAETTSPESTETETPKRWGRTTKKSFWKRVGSFAGAHWLGLLVAGGLIAVGVVGLLAAFAPATVPGLIAGVVAFGVKAWATPQLLIGTTALIIAALGLTSGLTFRNRRYRRKHELKAWKRQSKIQKRYRSSGGRVYNRVIRLNNNKQYNSMVKIRREVRAINTMTKTAENSLKKMISELKGKKKEDDRRSRINSAQVMPGISRDDALNSNAVIKDTADKIIESVDQNTKKLEEVKKYYEEKKNISRSKAKAKKIEEALTSMKELRKTAVEAQRNYSDDTTVPEDITTWEEKLAAKKNSSRHR